MTKNELAELEEVLGQMTTADLLQIKRMSKAEIDSRKSGTAKPKSAIQPHMAWGEILTRSGIDA